MNDMCIDEIIRIRDRLFSDLSTWKSDLTHHDTFMIGNGRVSAVLGWGGQINDMGWILGPYYENGFDRAEQDGLSYFGTQIVRLVIAGRNQEVNFEKGFIGRVRKTDVIVSRIDNGKGIQWDTIDYCSPDKNIITRLFILQNIGSEKFCQTMLEASWQKPDEIDVPWGRGKSKSPAYYSFTDPSTGIRINEVSVMDSQKRNRTLSAAFNVYAEYQYEKAYISIPQLEPGEAFCFVECMVISSNGSVDATKHKDVFERCPEDLLDTITNWKTWSASGATVRSSEQWFDDLIDSVKVWCRAQQSSHGVFSPMLFYTDGYVRDCNGPFRLFLRLGMTDECVSIMNFFRKAAIYNVKNKENSIFSGVNNIRLDLDEFIDSENDDVDWNSVDPGKAEIPCFLILWHWWYWLYTNDLSYAKRDWQLLLRCLDSQHISDRNCICFHGDETYKFLIRKKYTGVDHPFYEIMFSDEEYGSFESSALFLYALDAMNRLAAAMDKTVELVKYNTIGKKVRKSLDVNFWDDGDQCYRMACGGRSGSLANPHTIALVEPCWIEAVACNGNTVLDTDKVRLSWQKSLDFLETQGWNHAAPYINVTNGHIPGLMLCGATRFGKEAIGNIIEKAKSICTPAGAYAEMYSQFDSAGARGYHGKAWGRLRPWESGINVESMIFAITGFRIDGEGNSLCIDPYLPEDWTFFSICDLKCIGTILDLKLEKTGEKSKCTILNHGNEPIYIRFGGGRSITTILYPSKKQEFII